MTDKKTDKTAETAQGAPTSRVPRFYRLSVEQRLAWLQRAFGLDNDDLAKLRQGNALRVRHAVNMVENAIGVFGLPLGLGLNFLVDGREYIVPMAIEEASIIAAASKSALLIRGGGGFTTEVDEPVMIGQVQVLDVTDLTAAQLVIRDNAARIIERANLINGRMVGRGGGVFAVETRVVEGSEATGPMLLVHLLMDVREAMGANAVNSACEAAGPLIAELTGGRVQLRILSNLADRRLARARFRLPVEKLAIEGLDGADVARRMVEASALAEHDPYRATTHNKGIFNGIDAAAIAFGQDWRAIEAGGHAYAARDGRYTALTRFHLEDGALCGELEMPLAVGWRGGAAQSHPGVEILRRISGVGNARELAGLLAAVGLAQNFGACLALVTVGIQRGHMALHARSVALSVGTPAGDVDEVAAAMINRGEVRVAIAEEILRDLKRRRENGGASDRLPITASAPGKVVLFGEHAVVYGQPGITASIDLKLTVRLSHDPDGPRLIHPQFKHLFPIKESESDFARFGNAVNSALEAYGLEREPIAIEVDSELQPGMGLGSSAAFSVALCLALRRYRGLDHQRRWDPELFEEAQRLERIFHGTPSGIDVSTVLSGGVLWFRGGQPREILPVRLPRPASALVCIAEAGARTIELVQQVKHSRQLNRERTDRIIRAIGELSARAGSALGAGDFAAVGEKMYRNHELLAELGVSTPGLDRCVDMLRDNGALGAKLTGAGGGGAVVALAEPAERGRLIEVLSAEFPLVVPFELGAAE